MKKIISSFSITFAISLLLLTACEKAPETPPVASFTVSSDVSRTGESIFFQNTSVGAKTFTWDFGDGNNSKEENPSHIYTETGTYTIQLEVSNSGESDKASKGVLITLWSTGTPMSTGRWEFATCMMDGKIYAIGGLTGWFQQASRILEIYHE